jgi:hypothetical protein
MNTKVPNYHVLIVTYKSWTNKGQSSINIRSECFNQTVKIPFDTDHGNDSCEIAEHWLQSKGFTVIGHAEGKDNYYVITDTFLPLDHYKRIITKPAQ